MAKPPRQLIKQVENLEEIIKALNSLIDGSKIKLEFYDSDFFERLSNIRKNGLELRDEIQIFKNDLEHALDREYNNNGSNRFAYDINMERAKKVIASFAARSVKYE